MASQDWLEKDFYAILGVSQDASDAEIKKAYRKLARTWHPDQNPGDTAAEQKFKDIGEANSVLSDPDRRKEYDQLRQMVGGGARFTAGGPGGMPGGGAGGFEDLFSQFGGARTSGGGAGGQQINLDDILGRFGGGGSPFGGGGYGGFGAPSRGADLEARTTLSFRSAAEGQTVSLQAADGATIKTRIPAGVKDGQTIRLRGKGQPGEAGAGDLLLRVTVEPHPVFGRDGNNLTVDLPVTFAEAALGATVSVPTLEGAPVKVKVAAGTPSGRKLRVKGRGVKTSSTTGDLIATVSVVVPTTLTDETRAAIETLATDADGDPRAELFAKARA
ncbi:MULTISPECIES: DnaJ C-terminal domain-containing protein [Allobranchiibius]|uniref:Molecular chaperone DnaJ n=1 Tax=Allobranchiibius huperziae TaxID=1874116 RepID=A0A853DN55_9MICO|nr:MULTISPECIES: DnaJ C-terminal domain-containing protein [Allobranchiibius]NYJ76050.1 molecular chaperone DnaJ [Allobranchiibius huperziae]UIJ35839.1 DnaJ domain-containing protein [Allobranchiibius sp. GilTou73]